MQIDILIHTQNIRQHLKVSQCGSALGDKVIDITSVMDERDYSKSDSERVNKVTTISVDETGARQLMLALQKILW